MTTPDYYGLPKIIAHRCNSIQAFKQALTIGDKHNRFYIECDVRMTKDKILVVHHDAVFENNMIQDSTYNQLGPNILQLDSILDLANKHRTMLHLDVKAEAKNGQWQAVIDSPVLIHLLKTQKIIEQVVVTTVAGDFLKQLRAYSDVIKLGVLYDEDYGTVRPLSKKAVHAFIHNILQFHHEVGLEGIFLNQEWIQLFENCYHCMDDFIYTMTKSGIKIAIWTVNDIAQAKKFMAWGVEWITTDKPLYFSGLVQNKAVEE